MTTASRDPRVVLGERIAQLRVRSLLTVNGLAAACELDPSNLRKIEKGEGNPRLATVLKIAGVLEIDPRDLFDGLDPYGLTGKDRPQPLSGFDASFWRRGDRIA
ncbi:MULTISPECIES: helix-turn-helix domain-containing protein [Microbacterium]|uniref:Helix-turn-helix domain-containing protein n=1 Tax=Microbacterium resistens TaxID=156977 RepID=A0ABY3RRG3_9MICO|nr:helix-turn-helix transcriptional regulator [Microbacterium resistens]MDA4895407.1 helix-turn-helix transcriptional regulator [Streptomyces sp. MS2A]UGS26698.1 helix-turn-helix domain-containing protein [Microbacterium resistens]